MNDKPQIKLSETVVLIDAAFLNFVITDMKGYFEDTLQRSLQEIDLSILTTYLTLDAGITKGKNEVQFLFVYDKESGPCLSPNVAVHPLRPAMDRRLGGPLPHQQANPTRVHLIPPEFFTLSHAALCAYAVLAAISDCYPPV